jgi:hypothetical protein
MFQNLNELNPLENELTLKLSRYETEYLQNYSLCNVYKRLSCGSSTASYADIMQAIQVCNRTDIKCMTNTQPHLLNVSTCGDKLDT